MDFDFNLILVPITLLFFVIWLADKLVFKQRKNKDSKNENPIITWAYDFFPVLAFVLIVRSLIIEPFNIPSSSMKPSLYTGDFILVNKFNYGIKLPLLHTKVIPISQPKRGDVVVFRYPVNPKIYFIKRTVGLPGDTIRYKNGKLTVNGKNAPISPNKNFQTDDYSTVYNETFYNGGQEPQVHLMRDLNGVDAEPKAKFLQQTNPNILPKDLSKGWMVTVPKGHYFMMGDNRDESADSRFWGFVPESHISGKAFYVWMHKAPGFNMPSFSDARRIQ